MWGTEQWGLVALGGVATTISSIMYMWGGTEGWGKYWRRFIGSFVAALSANLIAVALNLWVWQYLLFYPILALGFSLGYGGSTTKEKIIKRTVFALGVLMTCVVGAWINQFNPMSLVVMGLALFTGLTSVVLGVVNPFKNAPLEQYIISTVLILYVPFWAFIRG